MDLLVVAEDAALPATLTVPRHPRAGLVVLHGSAAGGRDYFLYEHLARLLPPLGIAVLCYDRRQYTDGRDVTLVRQRDDAVAAIHLLERWVPGVPLGVWGYSQGAWVAELLAASLPKKVKFLIAVSAAGVSPARQMRAGSAEQLRRRGFSPAEVHEMLSLRELIENWLRSGEGFQKTQLALNNAKPLPWFPWASLPPALADPFNWPDMDFDPLPVISRLACPTLAIYGETDEWIPLPESIAAWAHAEGACVTIAQISGTDHLPTYGGIASPDSISDAYSAAIANWLTQQVPSLERLRK